MAQEVRHLRPHQKEFQKIFSTLCRSKSAWQVWSDFVEASAIAISNRINLQDDVWQKREEHYMNIIGKYGKDEQGRFAELFAVTVEALDNNPEQDFLGEMFMALELGSHWHGQFFTPYHVCEMMAKISIDGVKEKIARKGYVAVNDPACGAGATLIAARNALHKTGIGGQQAFFVAQDIDRTAGLMCYIQLSLLCCAGYVVIANTLTNPITGPLLRPTVNKEQDIWYMPMFVIDPVWTVRKILNHDNLPTHETAPQPKEEPKEAPKAEPQTAQAPPPAPKPKKRNKKKPTDQLTFF